MNVMDDTESGLDAGLDAAVEEMRTRIHAEQLRMQSLVDSLTASFDDLTQAADASPPDDEHDPEGHTIAFERSQLAARRDGYVHAIAELAKAECRLDDAGSAACETCGTLIPHERRLAVPATARCIECARPTQPGRLGAN
jgi:DnaK suppressor protein